MKSIKVNTNFTLNDKYYFSGDEFDPRKVKFEDLVRLNEKGYVGPIDIKDLMSIQNNKPFEVENNNKEENK